MIDPDAASAAAAPERPWFVIPLGSRLKLSWDLCAHSGSRTRNLLIARLLLAARRLRPRFSPQASASSRAPLLIWRRCVCFLIVYSTLTIPYRIGFDVESDVWSTLDWIVDACFMFDIVLTFLSARTDGHHRPIVSPKRLARMCLQRESSPHSPGPARPAC